MTNIRKTWLYGLGAGAICALIDVSLIVIVEPGISGWVLAQAALFWTTAGWAVVASESGLSRYAHSVLATVLLNLPWYVLEAFASGHPEHFPPLVLMSVVFGLAFGWAGTRARTTTSSRSPVARC